MAGKFNETKKRRGPDTVTFEGATAYEKTLDVDWLNNLFSNFVEDGYYESAEDRLARYVDLTKKMIDKYGPEFVARATFFARNELGMRSISHVTAAILNGYSFDRKRNFYANLMARPDDVSEIFSILDSWGQKRSHALVRGASDYVSHLSAYQIDKYSMKTKNWSMLDVINVTHPKSEVVDRFYNGTLQKAGTWEQVISASKTDEERNEAWKSLVENHDLGYMALIRNLNNILDSGVDTGWIIDNLVPQLTDREKILRSKVFPYRIYVAYKNLTVNNIEVVSALAKAFELSCVNAPVFDGDSLVILDVSGSMCSPISDKSRVEIKEACACYAAILYMRGNMDFVKFGSYAKRCEYNKLDNVFDVIARMCYNDELGCGTNISSALDQIDRHYDRIFIFSDMQVMDSSCYDWWWVDPKDRRDQVSVLHKCFEKFGKSRVYSFDLGNYKVSPFNIGAGDIMYLSALSEKVFGLLKLVEDNRSVIDYINDTYRDCF